MTISKKWKGCMQLWQYTTQTEKTKSIQGSCGEGFGKQEDSAPTLLDHSEPQKRIQSSHVSHLPIMNNPTS